MKIHVIEFYPFDFDKNRARGRMIGSMHVYLVALKMDIRGILVHKLKKGFKFYLPNGVGKEPETGRRVKFPIITFTDQKVQNSLTQSISAAGNKYMIEVYGK